MSEDINEHGRKIGRDEVLQEGDTYDSGQGLRITTARSGFRAGDSHDYVHMDYRRPLHIDKPEGIPDAKDKRIAELEANLKQADAILLEVWGAYNRIGDALKVREV